MAKFRFPFENVIKHRKTLEEVAQRNLQERLAVLNAEIAKLEFMREQVQEAIQRRHQIEIQGGGSAIGPLTQVHEFLQGQDIRIERQQKIIAEVEKEVDGLREILRLKAIDTKIVKELRVRRKKDFDTEVRKQEAKELDDINLMRFRLKRGTSG